MSELEVSATHCNQYRHVPGCRHSGDGWQRDYTIPSGREKTLPGNLALFSGYVANELGHGELADMQALADFLDSPPVGSVADSFFPRQGVKAKELAARIAAVYQEAGVSSLHVEPVGEVLLDRKGILNSIGHFSQNKKTTPEHKQRVTDAFALVPAVLQKGALVEYGLQEDNKNLHSYIYLAPVQIGGQRCAMAVRVKNAQGQKARFYLHGVSLIAELKEKAPKMGRIRGSGLGTGTPSGADHRDVFRVAKKAYGVKLKGGGVQAAHCNQYRHVPGCRHGSANTEVLAEARQNIEPLRGVLESAARALGGRAVMRPKNKEDGLETKAPSTAAAKAERDYGGDLSRVVDLIGGTCVLPDDGDYAQAVEAIRAALPEGASIAKVKKLGFGSPEACYQDVKVSVRFPNGGIGEVILVSEFMQDAKFNRGGHAVYELTRVIAPLKETDKKIGAAWKELKGLSSAIYSGETDSAAFDRAKAKASSALQALPLASMKASLSAEDMMVVKSSASLLKEAKPLSVSSAAIPSSSEIKKGISPGRVTNSTRKVKNKLQESAAKVKDEMPGADADGILRQRWAKAAGVKGARAATPSTTIYNQHTTDMNQTSSEKINTAQGAPESIPYMPAGEHIIHATVNGEPGCRRVVVDEAACARLNADLASKLAAAAARQQARPVVLFDHRQGEAAAYPRRFVWGGAERGILLEIEAWSEAGRRAVEGRNYGYISPSFRVSRSDGQVLGLTDGVEVASLVNDPAFERIDPIMDSVAAARAYDLPKGEGSDVVGARHCNQWEHVQGCAEGVGKWEADPKWSFGEAVQNVFSSENKPRKSHIFKVCDYPDVMKRIEPWEGNVVIRWDNMEKLHSKHRLTPEQIAQLPGELEKPIAVLEDPQRSNEYIIVTGLEAPDRNGDIKKAAAVLKLRKNTTGEIEVADLASAYSRDKADVYKYAIKEGKLRYLDKTRAIEWARLEEDNLPQLLTTSHAQAEGIIKGSHADVKGGECTMGIFALLCAISPQAEVENGSHAGENVKAAENHGGAKRNMNAETKKKLGLPEEADEAAVDAAVAELIGERDKHKTKAAEVEAECKKKDEELKAARAAEKDAWLADLKQRGVIAPQDEEAIQAASSLFEANATAARTAYGKMPAANDATIIQAGHPNANPGGERVEDFITFN